MTNREVISHVQRRAALWDEFERCADERADAVSEEMEAIRRLVVNQLLLTGRPVPWGKHWEVVLGDCKRHYYVRDRRTGRPAAEVHGRENSVARVPAWSWYERRAAQGVA